MECAAQLPCRCVLATSLDELPRKVSRELSLTAEVVGPELGEDTVTVFLSLDPPVNDVRVGVPEIEDAL